VGLRWKNINNGSKNTTKDNLVKALTVEVSAKAKWECSRKLLRLYSRSIKTPQHYPNGVRLRFVKLKKDAINKAEKSKMDKLLYRQKGFLNEIVNFVSYDIIQLDYSHDAGRIPTLRQMIMTLKTKNDTPLFHNVDMDWRQDGFTFQFSPFLEDEAHTAINTLLPLLKHYFPNIDVGANFSTDAEERCSTMMWDVDKQMILDTETEEDTGSIGNGEQLVGFEFSSKITEELERPTQHDRTHMPEDSDSVSTLRDFLGRSTGQTTANKKSQITGQTQLQTTTQAATPPTTHYNNFQTQDTSSSTSDTTTLTSDSYARLDHRLTGLAEQMAIQQHNHEKFMSSQSQQIQDLLQHVTVLAQQKHSIPESARNSNSGTST